MSDSMHPVLADVLQLLQLERIEDNIYRGASQDIGSPQVFGGQVLGQALAAAHQTVATERCPHSLHAYFLRRGDVNAPIVYQVDNQRDGGSFSNRRVVAIQHGQPILNMAASFHKPETGFVHQADMPDVAGPDGLRSTLEINRSIIDQVPEKMRRYLAHEPPFEFRPVEPPHFLNDQPQAPRKHIWMRAIDRLPDDAALHRTLLTYVSDYELLGTAMLPHVVDFGRQQVIMASLDHAMWFHRDARVDEWLLYAFDSPNAAGNRGFARGQIFTRDGQLLAATAQEGLIRVVS